MQAYNIFLAHLPIVRVPTIHAGAAETRPHDVGSFVHVSVLRPVAAMATC